MTRKLIKNVLTEEDARKLASSKPGATGPFSDCPTAVGRIIQKALEEVSDLETDGKAYWRTEVTSGHKVHNDLGFKFNDDLSPNGGGHMKWCKYGASCLLVPPDSFKGGEFTYYEPEENPPVEDHYLGLVIHDSKQLHKVNPVSQGTRIVLLMFFS